MSKITEKVIPQDLQVDIIINVEFLEELCKCDECTHSFSRIVAMDDAMNNMSEDEHKLEQNLDGELNDDEESEPEA